MTSSFIKDPDAVLTYSIDWADDGANDGSASDTGWLQGATISTSTWSISGPDALLVNDTDDNSATVATITLSGGTSNRNYTVTNHIVASNGLEDDRSLLIQVRQR